MKAKQTFILEVNRTQNQSWQGNLEWIQGKRKQPFCGVMEMLRLIDSVVYEENDMTGESSFAPK